MFNSLNLFLFFKFEKMKRTQICAIRSQVDNIIRVLCGTLVKGTLKNGTSDVTFPKDFKIDALLHCFTFPSTLATSKSTDNLCCIYN
jgi:hypothetical protein